jgi:DNA segregation ATPase FtsK/SpoIIIE, S-DNA-T family
MPKKTSKTKTKKRLRITSSSQKSINRDLWAVLLFISAFFVLICNQFPEATGLVGYWLITTFSSLFGYRGFLFMPLFLALPGISLLVTKNKHSIIFGASAASYLCFVIMLERYYRDTLLFLTWPVHHSTIGGYAGVIGHYFLFKLMGKYGTTLVILGVFLASAILMFGVSLKRIYIYINTILDSVEFVIPLGTSKKKTSKKKTKGALFEHSPLRFLFYKKIKDEKLPYDDLVVSKAPKVDIKSFQEESFDIPDIAIEETPLPEMVNEEKLKKVRKKKPTDAPTDLDTFTLPPLALLKSGGRVKINVKEQAKYHKEQSEILEMTLSSFNVAAKVVNVSAGPSVTRFELKPGDGVKISKITNLAKDIALKLAAADIRIEAPIPGKALVGIEVPNASVETITIRSIMETTDFYESESMLQTVLGLTITGESILMDVGKMPHVLIAGATGSGKSVCINAIILSILMKAKPEDVKFLMIDPKKVELSLYQDIPHLVAPVVTNPHQAAATLKKWALLEMESRYEEFSRVGVKDIAGYNAYVKKELAERAEKIAAEKAALESTLANPEDIEDQPSLEKLPFIVVVIDELADLMMVASQDVENTICRLAQMARATGIHLVIATQRPSVNVVTGLIKANVPSRISFFLQSQIDSRTIIDMPGAEKLLGKGDMLYSPVGSFKPKRAQGVFVTETEVKNVVEWLKKQGPPDYDTEASNVEADEVTDGGKSSSTPDEDPLLEEAKQLIMSTQYASTSYLQRKLRIGYNRAARIMDDLNETGFIAQHASEKKPQV